MDLNIFSQFSARCSETYQRSHSVPRDEAVTYWGRCRKLWYNKDCIKYRTEYRYITEYTTEQRTKLITSCCLGYKKGADKEGAVTCTPICQTNCTNGVCAAPNTCVCNDGYTISPDNDSKCIPFCRRPCSNADCTAPDVCSCHPGFRPVAGSNSSECEPEFDKRSCTNGKWIPPNNCECNEGYNIYNGTENGLDCIPECKSPCENGKCIAPGICSCYVGYKEDMAGHCLPICDESCEVHGKCIAPGLCECKEGFRARTVSGYETCTLHCANGCLTRTNVCLIGYQNRSNNSNTILCDPRCDNGCKNGECIAPGQCKCNDGYSSTLTDECQPVCAEKCINAECESPHTCKCKEGYEFERNSSSICSLKESSTKPSSTEPLEGETSTEPTDLTMCIPKNCSTTRECNECPTGYKETATMHCCPTCTLACVNSFCAEPEMCLCHEGYRVRSFNATDSNVCYPICSADEHQEELTDNCINGHCIAYNKCKCLDGFEPSGNDTLTCVACPPNGQCNITKSE